MRNYIDQKTKTIGGAGHIVRALADSSDMGATWGPVRFAASLPDPICFSDLLRYPNATCPLFSRPLFARLVPSFRRSFAVSGFLAPRRRERAKNGVKWAEFGGEAEKKR